MSGFLVSTGMLTNNWEKLEKGDIIDIMKLKIETIFNQIFSPTLSHISIQKTLENNSYDIIEYFNILLKIVMK